MICPVCKSDNVNVLGLDRRFSETTIFFSCLNTAHQHGGFSIGYLKNSVEYIKKLYEGNENGKNN